MLALAVATPGHSVGNAYAHDIRNGRLTACDPGRIIGRVSDTRQKASMSTMAQSVAAQQEWQLLEQRLDELVTVVTQLKEENRALRQRLDTLMTERAGLLQKNEQVRARVEAMIGRLKAMEHGA
jgi:cell division protein ZapB